MLGRIIIIGAAAFLGVLVALISFTRVTPVQPDPEMPVFGQKSNRTVSNDWNGKPIPNLLDENRRARAEQLVGEPLIYITNGRVISVDWLVDKGPNAVQRAMDECFLLVDETLSAEHVHALLEADLEDGELDESMGFQMSVSQWRSCENAAQAYEQIRG